jgi:hypothetical protein
MISWQCCALYTAVEVVEMINLLGAVLLVAEQPKVDYYYYSS